MQGNLKYEIFTAQHANSDYIFADTYSKIFMVFTHSLLSHSHERQVIILSARGQALCLALFHIDGYTWEMKQETRVLAKMIASRLSVNTCTKITVKEQAVICCKEWHCNLLSGWRLINFKIAFLYGSKMLIVTKRPLSKQKGQMHKIAWRTWPMVILAFYKVTS